jgi:hypothetical protein
VTASLSRSVIARANTRQAAAPERFITAAAVLIWQVAARPQAVSGYFDFSDTFTLADNPVLRVSQLAVEAVRRPTQPNLFVSQLAIETVARLQAPIFA